MSSATQQANTRSSPNIDTMLADQTSVSVTTHSKLLSRFIPVAEHISATTTCQFVSLPPLSQPWTEAARTTRFEAQNLHNVPHLGQHCLTLATLPPKTNRGSNLHLQHGRQLHSRPTLSYLRCRDCWRMGRVQTSGLDGSGSGPEAGTEAEWKGGVTASRNSMCLLDQRNGFTQYAREAARMRWSG